MNNYWWHHARGFLIGALLMDGCRTYGDGQFESAAISLMFAAIMLFVAVATPTEDAT